MWFRLNNRLGDCVYLDGMRTEMEAPQAHSVDEDRWPNKHHVTLSAFFQMFFSSRCSELTIIVRNVLPNLTDLNSF